ncbi:hypothetical protein V8E52_011886, partial [Russula decolorans]
DITCNDLPNVGLRRRPGKYYVKLFVDKDIKETAVAARGCIASWNEAFYFDVHGASVLELRVCAQHMLGRQDDYIGGVKETINSLLAGGETKAVTRNLRKDDGKGNMQTVVKFTITSFATSADAAKAQMDEAVDQGRTALDNMKSLPLLPRADGAVAEVVSAIGRINTISAAWDPLLKRIEKWTVIVDKISEIHPYAKIAWTLLSAAHKTILAQKDRDDNINRLLGIMKDTYDFIEVVDPLKKVESHKPIVILLTHQTTECGYFIGDYAKNKSFLERTLKHLGSDVDSKVIQFEAKFKKLQLALQARAVVHTEITVLRILDVVNNLTTEIDLNDMPYAAGAWYDADKGCLPGTREEVIDEIGNWVNNDSDDLPQIFFLTGFAGAGKSAIAHAVARLFDERRHLGSSYFFDAAHQVERSPKNVFSTIARDLADRNPELRASLWKVVEPERSLRTTDRAGQQFQRFILDPAKDLKTIRPIVIVIDALDESGDAPSREDILSILTGKAAKLPSNFRVLVTGRAERDIRDALDGNKHVISKYMESFDANNDIFFFVQTQLCTKVAELEQEWPKNLWCQMLVDKSEGLFLWASTACRFIKGNGEELLDPVEQLKILVSSASRSAQLSQLDELYTRILTRIFTTNGTDRMGCFRSVVGCMLAAREPLSISALEKLCSDKESANAVEQIIRPLGSLFSGVTQKSIPIRLLHTSFRDFLTDRDRSGLFYIDTSSHHHTLTLSTLRVIKEELRFNICQLETSHRRNKDVSDLVERAEKAISSHLSYSCRFWADHLRSTSFAFDINDEIRDFLHTRLLLWLEVLSLIKGDDNIAACATDARKSATDARKFATDARKFTTTFGSVISQSAPHIYLLALPFTPEESQISQKYLPQFPQLLRIESGKKAKWPAIQNVLEAHTSGVLSVAFSQDGKHIVSGSEDKTIRVWDADTSDVVSGPFKGHTGTVFSVVFSQNGKRIASGSDDYTIRVWDADTGNIVSGPFKGHTGWVRSVAFSQDGKHIVSGSDDKTIRVWDADTGDVVSGPFKGHTGWVFSDSLKMAGGADILENAIFNGFRSDSQLENGWVMNSPSELLFWVPPWSRIGLWWPGNTAVIADWSTKLDCSQFVHGTSWEKCQERAQDVTQV